MLFLRAGKVPKDIFYFLVLKDKIYDDANHIIYTCFSHLNNSCMFRSSSKNKRQMQNELI